MKNCSRDGPLKCKTQSNVSTCKELLEFKVVHPTLDLLHPERQTFKLCFTFSFQKLLQVFHEEEIKGFGHIVHFKLLAQDEETIFLISLGSRYFKVVKVHASLCFNSSNLL